MISFIYTLEKQYILIQLIIINKKTPKSYAFPHVYCHLTLIGEW